MEPAEGRGMLEWFEADIAALKLRCYAGSIDFWETQIVQLCEEQTHLGLESLSRLVKGHSDLLLWKSPVKQRRETVENHWEISGRENCLPGGNGNNSPKKRNASCLTRSTRKPLVDSSRVNLNLTSSEDDGEGKKEQKQNEGPVDFAVDNPSAGVCSLIEEQGSSRVRRPLPRAVKAEVFTPAGNLSKRRKRSTGWFETGGNESSMKMRVRGNCVAGGNDVYSQVLSPKKENATPLPISRKKPGKALPKSRRKPLVDADRIISEWITCQSSAEAKNAILVHSVDENPVLLVEENVEISISAAALDPCALGKEGRPSPLLGEPHSNQTSLISAGGQLPKRRKKPAGAAEPVIATRMTRSRAKVVENASNITISPATVEDDTRDSMKSPRVVDTGNSLGKTESGSKCIEDIQVFEGRILPKHPSGEERPTARSEIEPLLATTKSSETHGQLFADEVGADVAEIAGLDIRGTNSRMDSGPEEQRGAEQVYVGRAETLGEELNQPTTAPQSHEGNVSAKESGCTVTDIARSAPGKHTGHDQVGSSQRDESSAATLDEEPVQPTTTRHRHAKEPDAKDLDGPASDTANVDAGDMNLPRSDGKEHELHDCFLKQLDAFRPAGDGTSAAARCGQELVRPMTTPQGHSIEFCSKDDWNMVAGITGLEVKATGSFLGNAAEKDEGQEAQIFQFHEEGSTSLDKEPMQPRTTPKGHRKEPFAAARGSMVNAIPNLEVRNSNSPLEIAAEEQSGHQFEVLRTGKEGCPVMDYEAQTLSTTTPQGFAKEVLAEEGGAMVEEVPATEIIKGNNLLNFAGREHRECEVEIVPTPILGDHGESHPQMAHNCLVEEIATVDYSRLHANVGCRSESRVVRLMSRKCLELSGHRGPFVGDARTESRLRIFHGATIRGGCGSAKDKVLSQSRSNSNLDPFDSVTKRRLQKRPRDWCNVRTQLESKYVDCEMTSREDLGKMGEKSIIDSLANATCGSSRLQKYAKLSTSKMLELVSSDDTLSPKPGNTLDGFSSLEHSTVEDGGDKIFLQEPARDESPSVGGICSKTLSGPLPAAGSCALAHGDGEADSLEAWSRETGTRAYPTAQESAEEIPSDQEPVTGAYRKLNELQASQQLAHSVENRECGTDTYLPPLSTTSLARECPLMATNMTGPSHERKPGFAESSLSFDVSEAARASQFDSATGWQPEGSSGLSRMDFDTMEPSVILTKEADSSFKNPEIVLGFPRTANSLCGTTPGCGTRPAEESLSDENVKIFTPSVSGSKQMQEVSSPGDRCQEPKGLTGDPSMTAIKVVSMLQQTKSSNPPVRSSNLVSSMQTFVPTFQRPPPTFLPTGKRDVKVKALEAAEVAKQMEEKREAERRDKLMRKTQDLRGCAQRAKEETTRMHIESVEASKKLTGDFISKAPLLDGPMSKHLLSPDEKLKRAVASKLKMQQDKVNKFKEEIRKKEERKNKLLARKQKKEELDKKEHAEKMTRQKEFLRQRKEQESRLRAELEEKEKRALEDAEQRRKAIQEEIKRQRLAEKDRERERHYKMELDAKAARAGKTSEGLMVPRSGLGQPLRYLSGDTQAPNLVGTGPSLSLGPAGRVPIMAMDGRTHVAATPMPKKGASLFSTTRLLSLSATIPNPPSSTMSNHDGAGFKNDNNGICLGSPGLEEGPASYEISPYRDSSDEEDEELRPAKRIPFWARKENLKYQLQKQQTQDPDSIFPGSKTCSLKDVFGTNGSKKVQDFSKRSHSGDWVADLVSHKEELQYKIKMGYVQKYNW